MIDRFSEGRDVDGILRHDTSEIRPVVDGVVGRDVEMRQFVKGRMIVQDVGDERRFRVGVVATESQHGEVPSQSIPKEYKAIK